MISALGQKTVALYLRFVHHRYPVFRPEKYLRSVEALRCNSDDGEWMLVEIDRYADDSRVGIESFVPDPSLSTMYGAEFGPRSSLV